MLRANRHGVERRSVHPAHAIGHDHHLVEPHLGVGQHDVHLLPLAYQLDRFLHGLIAKGRNDQRVVSHRSDQVIQPLLVGGTTIGCSLQIDGSIGHLLFFISDDFTRQSWTLLLCESGHGSPCQKTD